MPCLKTILHVKHLTWRKSPLQNNFSPLNIKYSIKHFQANGYWIFKKTAKTQNFIYLTHTHSLSLTHLLTDYSCKTREQTKQCTATILPHKHLWDMPIGVPINVLPLHLPFPFIIWLFFKQCNHIKVSIVHIFPEQLI